MDQALVHTISEVVVKIIIQDNRSEIEGMRLASTHQFRDQSEANYNNLLRKTANENEIPPVILHEAIQGLVHDIHPADVSLSFYTELVVAFLKVHLSCARERDGYEDEQQRKLQLRSELMNAIKSGDREKAKTIQAELCKDQLEIANLVVKNSKFDQITIMDWIDCVLRLVTKSAFRDTRNIAGETE